MTPFPPNDRSGDSRFSPNRAGPTPRYRIILHRTPDKELMFIVRTVMELTHFGLCRSGPSNVGIVSLGPLASSGNTPGTCGALPGAVRRSGTESVSGAGGVARKIPVARTCLAKGNGEPHA